MFRYLNTRGNVWLEPFDSNAIRKFNIKSNSTSNIRNGCFAIKSLKDEENGFDSTVGNIVIQNCESLGATVCETSIKPTPRPQPPIEPEDPNSEFVPIRRIKLSNGNESQIFTGLYYKITSKSNNQVFMDQSRGIVSDY